jgi:1,2-diacylglycerol 3-alpha-glucosyltransferase
MNQKIRVLFSCVGLGIWPRGNESLFREAFDALKNMPGIDAMLLKGSGITTKNEFPVWCLPRTGYSARWFGKVIRRNSYVAEQMTSFPFIVREILKFRPQIIFHSDPQLGFLLYSLRKWIGVPYRLIFSNGGPIPPQFVKTDFIHHIAPHYQLEALSDGELPQRHLMVPLGIRIPSSPKLDESKRCELRARLNMPLDRYIVLSVGWIAREHKRMHYVIEELAQLPKPRPFLQLLGAMDVNSLEIIELATRLLGPENFCAKSVPYEQVGDYYRAADCFVLASLKEGFGRVYLEALMNGLPVIAHNFPVTEYVLGGQGVTGNLNKTGVLADLIKSQTKICNSEEAMKKRWESVRDRFSWPIIAPQYINMFKGATENE